MNEKPGYLNEPDLVEEIIDEASKLADDHAGKGYGEEFAIAILAAFMIMTKRGLLNELGIEQVTRSLEHYSQRQ